MLRSYLLVSQFFGFRLRLLESFPGHRRLDLELTYRDDAPERETDYYYVHVLQEDGEQAWCSPMWVSRQGG